MVKIVICPYCKETIEKPAPDCFHPCPKCGYKSAWVGSGNEGYLVIDSQLPDLISKYDELEHSQSRTAVVIDRRIGQNPIAGTDRRR